jgi:transposase
MSFTTGYNLSRFQRSLYECGNGQVECQINRLKTVKRAMFGRADFDFLKARVLNHL